MLASEVSCGNESEPFHEETFMRFYIRQHKHYCGIDLHARTMYLCILDLPARFCYTATSELTPEAFLKAVAKYREDLVVAVECIFTW